jgi:hypothetical protein
MSIYYLLDPFQATQQILDVTSATPVNATGTTVVRVPKGVSIRGNPTNMAQLQSAKSDGMLEQYEGFSQIVHNDCLSSAGVDATASSRVVIGSGTTHHCVHGGGTLVTPAQVLGYRPAILNVAWEVYSVLDTDVNRERLTRTYVEELSSLLTCTATFGGAAGFALNSGRPASVPPAAPGTLVDPARTLVLRFQNPLPTRLFLGSWSVIY